MAGAEALDITVEPGAVAVFTGAMVLAGELAQQYEGHYAVEVGTHNGRPGLWTSQVAVSVPDQKGATARYLLSGMDYNQHVRLTASGVDVSRVDRTAGAYIITEDVLPAVARLGGALSAEAPVWSVHDTGSQSSTADLEIHTAGILPLTARLWGAIGHGIMRSGQDELPAQAQVTQRMDSAGRLYNQPTAGRQSTLSFVCTRPEGVVNRFEMTLRSGSRRTNEGPDEPSFVRATCSVSATYPTRGDKPPTTFRDTIQQTGTTLEVVRTREVILPNDDPEIASRVIRQVDELGRAPASGETMYRLALAATYAAPLPKQVAEWGV